MLLGFDPMSLLTPDLGLVFWTTVVFLVFGYWWENSPLNQ